MLLQLSLEAVKCHNQESQKVLRTFHGPNPIQVPLCILNTEINIKHERKLYVYMLTFDSTLTYIYTYI